MQFWSWSDWRIKIIKLYFCFFLKVLFAYYETTSHFNYFHTLTSCNYLNVTMLYWDMLYHVYWCFVATEMEYRQWFCKISLSEEILARPVGRIKVSLKIKFVHPERKVRVYDVRTRKNAIPVMTWFVQISISY